MTNWILPLVNRSRILGRVPSDSLLTFSHSMPFSRSRAQVPAVAIMLKPASAKPLATSTTSALSLRLTEISTVPSMGSLEPVPS